MRKEIALRTLVSLRLESLASHVHRAIVRRVGLDESVRVGESEAELLLAATVRLELVD